MKRIGLYIIFGISFLLALQVNAQDLEKEKLFQLGLDYDTLMYGHINKGDFSSALEKCSKKEDYFFKAESWSNYVKSKNDRAWIYHRIDSLKLLKEAVFSNFEVAKKYLTSEDLEWIRAKEQVNTYYHKIGDYESSLEILKEIIILKEKLNLNKFEVAATYVNLGTAYNRLRDTENALRNFKKSIKVIYGDGLPGQSSGERYNQIARTFKSRGDLDSALVYLKKSELLYKPTMLTIRFKAKKVETYILFIETYLEKKEFEKAKYYLDLTEKLPLSTRETTIWHEKMGTYYREIKDYQKSKNSILTASNLAKESGVRYSPPLRARRKIELAKTYIGNGQDEEALIVLQDGLKLLAPTFNSEDFKNNPKSGFLFDKPYALIILQEKARILHRKYVNSGSEDYLKASFDTYQVACDVIRDVRQGIRSSDSKNDLSERSISVYEEAIQAAFELSRITANKDYISIAFKLAESNKAQLLLENLNEQEARGFEGIPDSILEKENNLRLYLAALEDRALRGSINKDDDKIFKLRQELIQFSSFLENSYPRYYKLKYNNDPIEPELVQNQLLNDSTALVEYFVGIEKIYVFVITKNDLFMDELVKDSVEMDQIANFRNLLKNQPGNDSPENEYANFVKSSRQVYSSFVKGALAKIPKSVNTLIIVPDDQINYIPFEVLLLDEPQNDASYSLSSQSYLFEDFAVNYNYSATLLHKVISKDNEIAKANFIGYAPTFAGDSKNESRLSTTFELSNLKCSKDEVNSILSIVGGEQRISEKATMANFLKEAKDYKIIHLATHAFVNQSDSKLNRIFLQDDFLSDVNLYNLELNTEMAVLSACNTGSGELLKGEGVMNLARGFINAGCSSTIMSMWSVDDCATADLMLMFYKEIKKGSCKDEALRKAKIEYLNSANKTKLHPYYWAAFIPFGNMKAIDLHQPWYAHLAVPMVLILSVFGLFLFYYFKKK